MKQDQEQAPTEVLSGWKDIANYLGKGVRTVQRYEWQMGLPVRRPAGKPHGSVVATKPEVDAWVSASPLHEPLHLFRPLSEPSLSARASIASSVKEFRSLRIEMAALREQMHASIHTLRQTVQNFQHASTRPHVEGPYSLLEKEFRHAEIFGLLRLGASRRKIN